MVISISFGVVSNYKYSYLNNTLVTKSHDPPSNPTDAYDARSQGLRTESIRGFFG